LANHKALTVGEIETLADALLNPEHNGDPNCLCNECTESGDTMGCENPHRCFQKAAELLNLLPPKWHPKSILVEEEGIIVDETDTDETKRVNFNKNLETTGTLKEIFRIFTEGETSNTLPIIRNDDEQAQNITLRSTACILGQNEDKRLGAAVYHQDDSTKNLRLRLNPPENQAETYAELEIMAKACNTTNTRSKLNFESGSKGIVQALTRKFKTKGDQGFLLTPNSKSFQLMAAKMRARKQATTFLHKKKTRTQSGSNTKALKANQLAQEAIESDEMRIDDNLIIHPSMRITGAKLSVMTQAIAYKIIRVQKMRKYSKRRRTTEIIEQVRERAEEIHGKTLTEAEIWKGTRHRDLARTTRYFLWMTMHNAYMIGDKWLRPSFAAEFQERSECRHCRKTETMTHILTECEAPGQSEIWALARELWEKKTGKELDEITLADILGSPAIEESVEDKKLKEKRSWENRFYRILITESAHLIWKIRCKRVIQNEGELVTANEVRNKWLAAINVRIELDRKMTNPKYEKKALKKSLVLGTWKGVLKNERDLPDDWIRENGVLVGMDIGE